MVIPIIKCQYSISEEARVYSSWRDIGGVVKRFLQTQKVISVMSVRYSLFEVSLPSATIKFHSIEARCNSQQLCIAVRDESKKKVCHR